MFEVEYNGANSITLSTKSVRAVFDPNIEQFGLANVNVKDSIIMATEPRFVATDDSAKLVIDGSGEYEIGDMSIVGIAAQRHIDTADAVKSSTIYRVSIGEINGVVLGNISAQLNDDQLEQIGMVDFLVIPVGGGGYTLDHTEASAVVRQIDPKAIIPVHYADPAVKYEVPQDNLADFVKEMSVAVMDSGVKWKVKNRSDIPEVPSVIKIDRR